jgi:hypothetical protein
MATFATPGVYHLRLLGDDGSATSFQDLSFNGFTSPYDVWTWQQFGSSWTNPAIAGDTADPDGDSMQNLMEYATGTNPNVPTTSGTSYDTEIVLSQKYLRLTVTKNSAATELQYVVEATGTPDNAGSWSSAGLVTEVNTAAQLRVRDTVALTSPSPRFMRLRLVKP